MMKTPNSAHFKSQYAKHCQHLKLKGLQPKTIEAYSRAIRRIGDYFGGEIDHLSEDPLLDYFSGLLDSHSWSTVKLDLYGLKFYYQHVLDKPWVAVNLVKPPRAVRIPAIVSVEEAGRLFATTRRLRYRVFFFTLYSLGLRLGEGLRLEVGDIDAAHHRVLVRNAKGNKDRLVPLPDNTLRVLRSFWRLHRHPRLLFPHARTADVARNATEPLERNGTQAALRRVVAEMGLKKYYPPQPASQLCHSFAGSRGGYPGSAAHSRACQPADHRKVSAPDRGNGRPFTEEQLLLPGQYPEKWVVDCQFVGKGDKVLIYLGRYLYRGVIREQDILCCKKGEVTYRFQDSKTKVWQTRTVSGADFLWRMLRHVLPRGFRRARNYGFLHPNSKQLIGLLQRLLRFDPKKRLATLKKRPAPCCPCCGGKMRVVQTQLPAGTKAVHHQVVLE